MAIDTFSMYGLVFECTPITRRAITLVKRRIGRAFRQRRTFRDDYLVYMSFAMAYEGLQHLTEVARASGCEPGVDFAELMEGEVIGKQPAWLRIEKTLVSQDPWLGLRPDTWDGMEPDVREIYERMRIAKKPVFFHIKEERQRSAPDA